MASAAPRRSRSIREHLARLLASGATEVLAPGLYAWGITVAAPAVARSSGAGARIAAFVALVALVTGPVVALDHPRLGRAVGIWTALAASVATWVQCPSALAPGTLDAWQGALGALGWGVFALGWGAAERRVEPAEDLGDPSEALAGPPLEPRGKLGRGAVAVVAVAVVAAIVPLALAWRVVDVHRALFAHAVALACGVATVGTSALVAVGRGRWSAPRSKQRLASAATALMLVAAFALFGAAYALLR